MKLQDKLVIETSHAPAAIGTYSQAIRVGNTVYLSGQLPKSPQTGEMITGDFKKEVLQVFDNLSAVAKAAGGSLGHIVKLGIFLTDLAYFSVVNEVMSALFEKPYPARSTVQVSALPANARIEIEAIIIL